MIRCLLVLLALAGGLAPLRAADAAAADPVWLGLWIWTGREAKNPSYFMGAMPRADYLRLQADNGARRFFTLERTCWFRKNDKGDITGITENADDYESGRMTFLYERLDRLVELTADPRTVYARLNAERKDGEKVW